MPFINVKTNAKVSAEQADQIKFQLGTAITAIPGKSEGWLMVGIEGEQMLYFRGTEDPAAMVSVSLYGAASGNAMSTLTAPITAPLKSDMTKEIWLARDTAAMASWVSLPSIRASDAPTSAFSRF